MLPDPLPRRRASSIALNYCSDVMPLGLTRSDAAVGKLNVLYAVSQWVSPLGGDLRCWSKICESLEKDDAPWPLSSSSTKFSISKAVTFVIFWHWTTKGLFGQFPSDKECQWVIPHPPEPQRRPLSMQAAVSRVDSSICTVYNQFPIQ